MPTLKEIFSEPFALATEGVGKKGGKSDGLGDRLKDAEASFDWDEGKSHRDARGRWAQAESAAESHTAGVREATEDLNDVKAGLKAHRVYRVTGEDGTHRDYRDFKEAAAATTAAGGPGKAKLSTAYADNSESADLLRREAAAREKLDHHVAGLTEASRAEKESRQGSRSPEHVQAVANCLARLDDGLKALPADLAATYRGYAERAMQGMSHIAARRFADHVRGASFYASTAELTARLAETYPSARHTLEVEKQEIGGAYATGKKALHLDGGMAKGPDGSAMHGAGVYAHEFAHAIDGPKFEISHSSEWEEAWEHELKDSQLTFYGASCPTEGFAEFGRLALMNNTRELAERFPRCANVWRQHGILDAPDAPDAREHGYFAGEPTQLLDELFSHAVIGPGLVADCLLPESQSPPASFGGDTVVSCEEWATGRLAELVCYDGMPPATAARFNAILAPLVARYGVAFDALRVTDEKGYATVFPGAVHSPLAYYRDGEVGTLIINRDFFQRPGDFAAWSQRNKLVVDASLEGVLSHEYAHLLQWHFRWPIKDAFIAYMEDGGGLSGYADENPDEMLAEAFAAHESGLWLPPSLTALHGWFSRAEGQASRVAFAAAVTAPDDGKEERAEGHEEAPELSPEDEAILDRVWQRLAQARFADWDESKVHRGAGGRFGSGGLLSGLLGAAKSMLGLGPKPQDNDGASFKMEITPQDRDAFSKYLGRKADDATIAGLVGAEPGARIKVRVSPLAEVSHPGSGPSFTVLTRTAQYRSERTLYRDENGDPACHNDALVLKDGVSSGDGLGTRVFARQVANLSAAGFKRLTTDAVSGPASPGVRAFCGAYVWPRLGYDASIPKAMYARMPEEFSGAKRMHELMSLPGGADAWKKAQANCKVILSATFDLKEGSDSRKILDAYLREREAAGRPVHFAADPGDQEEAPELSPEDEEILDRVWQRLAQSHFADWDESAHPRGEGGRFGSGGSTAAVAKPERDLPTMLPRQGSWPKPGKVEITPEVRAELGKLLGRKADNATIAGLAGSEPGATIQVASFPVLASNLKGDGPSFRVITKAADYRSVRVFYRDEKGDLACYNSIIHTNTTNQQGGGLGTRVFARQVANLSAAGFKKITTEACSSKASNGDQAFCGAYVWPRLGYDATVPEKLRGKLGDEFAHATTMHELMKTPGGAAAWKKVQADEGDVSLDATFELKEGSTSRKILDAYLREREAAGRPVYFAATSAVSPAPTVDDHEEAPELSPEDEKILDRVWKRLARVKFSDWDESKHTRGKGGRFGPADGEAGESGGDGEAGENTLPSVLPEGGSWPAPGKVEITPENRKRFASFLGREADDATIAGMVGAEPGAVIRTGSADTLPANLKGTGPVISVNARTTEYRSTRLFYRDEHGNRVCYNHIIHMLSGVSSGSGLGTRVFARQVANLSTLGIDHIHSTAVSSPAADGDPAFCGAYTWPRLGYDAAVPDHLSAKLPEEFSGAKRMHELMSMPGGAAAWKQVQSAEPSVELECHFDLKQGSRSMQILEGYLRERAAAGRPVHFSDWDEGKHPRGSGGRFGGPESATGSRSPDSLPSPETAEGRKLIARALRLAVRRGNMDAPGETTDQCINAANVLKMVYPQAEVWSGMHEESHHTVAKLGGRFIDVTADQFGGERVRIMKRLLGAPDGPYWNFRREEDSTPKPDHWNRKMLEEFRSLLTAGQAGFSDWDESRHPRGHGGRFGSGGSGAASLPAVPDNETSDAREQREERERENCDPTRDYGNSSQRPSAKMSYTDVPPDMVDRARAWERDWIPSAGLDAFRAYLGNDYPAINRAMAAAGGDITKVSKTEKISSGMSLHDACNQMMSTLWAHGPHEKPLTVWRGMSLKPEVMAQFSQAVEHSAKTGEPLVMPVFGSSTLDPQFAVNVSDPAMAASRGKECILLEIRSRSGMYLGGTFIPIWPENEVLQPPTAKYRVVGYQDVRFGSTPRRILRLEELPPDPSFFAGGPHDPAARSGSAGFSELYWDEDSVTRDEKGRFGPGTGSGTSSSPAPSRPEPEAKSDSVVAAPPASDNHPLFRDHAATDTRSDLRQSDIPAELIHAVSGWLKGLSNDEVQAVKTYTGETYYEINKQLRASPDGSGVAAEHLATARHLQAALAKAPLLDRPMTTWRGLNCSTAAKQQTIEDGFRAALASGEPITLGGFGSATIDPGLAGAWGNTNVVFEIKSKRVGYVDSISSSRRENEVVHPHNASYRVLAVHEDSKYTHASSPGKLFPKVTYVLEEVDKAPAHFSDWDESKVHRGQGGRFGSGEAGGAPAELKALVDSPFFRDYADGERRPMVAAEDVPTEVSRPAAAWVDSLSEEQREILADYTLSAYKWLNKEMRQEPDPTKWRPGSGTQEYGHALQSALLTAPSFDQPMTSWRGLGKQYSAGNLRTTTALDLAHASGDTVQLAGFSSATLDPERAYDWGSGAILEIRSKRCSYVASGSSMHNELEVLHPHNASYKVVAVHENAEYAFGPRRTYVLEEVGEPAHFSDWDESAHPRGKGGRFGSGSGASVEAPEPERVSVGNTAGNPLFADHGEGARPPAGQSDLPAKAAEAVGRWLDGMSPEARESLVQYTIDDYRWVNRRLREGDDPDEEPGSESLQRFHDHVDRLQAALLDAPVLDQAMCSWRGIRGLSEEEEASLDGGLRAALASGDPVRLPAFGSATLSPQKAANWSFPGNVVLEVRSRRCSYIESITASPGELEVLHPHSTSYKVLAVHEAVPYPGRAGTTPCRTYVLEEVEPGPKRSATFAGEDKGELDPDGRWITVSGQHLHLDGAGQIEAGGHPVLRRILADKAGLLSTEKAAPASATAAPEKTMAQRLAEAAPVVDESWCGPGATKQAAIIQKAFDAMPLAAKLVGSPRVIISPDGGSAYAMGQIYLSQARQGAWQEAHYQHEFAHHLLAKTKLQHTPEFAEAMSKSVARATALTADELVPVVKEEGQAIRHEQATDLLRALMGADWGHEPGYMQKNDNHAQEVFCTAFAAYVRHNSRIWKALPELMNFMDKHFKESDDADFSDWDESAHPRGEGGRFGGGAGSSAGKPAGQQGSLPGDIPVHADKDHPLFCDYPPGEVRPMLDFADVPEDVDEAAAIWLAGLGRTQKRQLSDYTESDYIELNHMLRDPKVKPADHEGDPEAHDRALGIQRALLSAPRLDKPLTSWRGLSCSSPEKQEMIENGLKAALASGQSLRMAGFSSATLNPALASDWSKDTKVVLEIRSRRCSYLASVSQADNELEVLHPHNTLYKVVRVDATAGYANYDDPPERRRTYVLEEVEPGPAHFSDWDESKVHRGQGGRFGSGEATSGVVVTADDSHPLFRSDWGDEVRPLLGNSDLPQEIRSAVSKWLNGMSQEVQDAIEHYTGAFSYSEINTPLRNPALLADMDPELKRRADMIQKSLLAAPQLDRPMTSWRGLDCKPASQVKIEAGLRLGLESGQAVKLPGFNSATLSPRMAANWAGSSHVVLEIRSKRASYIRDISSSSREEEVLHPHNTSYRVVGVHEDAQYALAHGVTAKRRTYILEEVEPGPATFSDWDEGKHPRGHGGKFGAGSADAAGLTPENSPEMFLGLVPADGKTPNPKRFDFSRNAAGVPQIVGDGGLVYARLDVTAGDGFRVLHGIATHWPEHVGAMMEAYSLAVHLSKGNPYFRSDSSVSAADVAAWDAMYARRHDVDPNVKNIYHPDGSVSAPPGEPAFVCRPYSQMDNLNDVDGLEQAVGPDGVGRVQAWAGGFTPEQRNALRDYTGDVTQKHLQGEGTPEGRINIEHTSQRLNGILRKNPDLAGEPADEIEAGQRKAIALMSQAVENAPRMDEPVSTWSGIRSSATREAWLHSVLMRAAGTGESVTIPGFISSSFDPGAAQKFAKSGVVLEFRSRRFACLSGSGVALDDAEREVLHPHNSRWKVTEVVTKRYPRQVYDDYERWYVSSPETLRTFVLEEDESGPDGKAPHGKAAHFSDWDADKHPRGQGGRFGSGAPATPAAPASPGPLDVRDPEHVTLSPVAVANNPLFTDYGDGPRKRATEYDQPVALLKATTSWLGRISLEQKSAVTDYTGDEFTGLNGILRKGESPSPEEASTIQAIQSALLSAPLLDRPMTTWRGLDCSSQAKLAQIEDGMKAAFASGDPLVIPGFGSASICPRKAASWGLEKVVLEIKSRRVAYVESISATTGELEVLHPHNATYRVTAIHDTAEYPPYTASGGRVRRTYVLEEINEEGVKPLVQRHAGASFNWDADKHPRDEHGHFLPADSSAGASESGSAPPATGKPRLPDTWQEASSLADAKTQAKAMGILDLDCKGCADNAGSLQRANDVMRSLASMLAQAPALAERMATAPPLSKVVYHASKYVDCRPGVVGTLKGSVLSLGTRHPVTQELPKLGGWGVDDSVAGYLRHEYSHHVFDQLSAQEKKTWGDLYAAHDFSVVGKYAASESEEGFTESLCAFTHPKYAEGPQLPGAVHDFMVQLCRSSK